MKLRRIRDALSFTGLVLWWFLSFLTAILGALLIILAFILRITADIIIVIHKTALKLGGAAIDWCNNVLKKFGNR